VALALPRGDARQPRQPPIEIRPSRPAEPGIWLDRAEVRRLPMAGPAWQNVFGEASGPLPSPHVSDQNSQHDTSTLAVALVAVRTGNRAYRRKAAEAIDSAMGTEHAPSAAGSRHLPVCRNATSYVIAADLIDLHDYDAELDDEFRRWIRALRDTPYGSDDPTRLVHESRSNNHGTMCGAARAAISRYLGDDFELVRTAQVLKGWMGDRRSYRFEEYPSGADSYMPDAADPRPVNPPGAAKHGHNVDGLLPAEHARCGTFHWPPCYTFYVWGGLAGAVVTAEILRRAGYADVFEWESRALLRAYRRLYELSKMDSVWWQEATTGDDSWQPWLVNQVYGTDFPAVSPSNPGKNMGWTDWTHRTGPSAERTGPSAEPKSPSAAPK
jgi:hypothetical protein